MPLQVGVANDMQMDTVEGELQKTSLREGHTAGISPFCPSLPI